MKPTTASEPSRVSDMDEARLDKLLATRMKLARETAENEAALSAFCRKWSADHRCTVLRPEQVKKAMQFGGRDNG